ncbi:phosphopantetheine-binding protein [Oceanimonas sp. NS1]|nr:phosphopantetheine-binding protein [Oceanimonas sp. NS1]
MITFEKLVDVLKESGADVDFGSLTPEQKFENIGLDSLDMFNFFTEIDDKFGIDVPDEDFEQLDTMEKLKNYLEQRLNG